MGSVLSCFLDSPLVPVADGVPIPITQSVIMSKTKLELVSVMPLAPGTVLHLGGYVDQHSDMDNTVARETTSIPDAFGSVIRSNTHDSDLNTPDGFLISSFGSVIGAFPGDSSALSKDTTQVAAGRGNPHRSLSLLLNQTEVEHAQTLIAATTTIASGGEETPLLPAIAARRFALTAGMATITDMPFLDRILEGMDPEGVINRSGSLFQAVAELLPATSPRQSRHASAEITNSSFDFLSLPPAASTDLPNALVKTCENNACASSMAHEQMNFDDRVGATAKWLETSSKPLQENSSVKLLTARPPQVRCSLEPTAYPAALANIVIKKTASCSDMASSEILIDLLGSKRTAASSTQKSPHRDLVGEACLMQSSIKERSLECSQSKPDGALVH